MEVLFQTFSPITGNKIENKNFFYENGQILFFCQCYLLIIENLEEKTFKHNSYDKMKKKTEKSIHNMNVNIHKREVQEIR